MFKRQTLKFDNPEVTHDTPKFDKESNVAFENRNSVQNNKKIKKLALYVGAAIGITVIASQFVTTVSSGNNGVPVSMGEVIHDRLYSEGFGFKLPWWTIVEIPYADQSIPRNGVSIDNHGRAYANGELVIQTADKMTTGLNVEMLMNVKPSCASKMVQQAGNIDGIVKKYVIPALEESLNVQGSSVHTAQLLFGNETKEQLKAGTIGDMNSYLNSKTIMGDVANCISVKDVKYGRMVLPPRIQEMINKTKEREEAEEIALSSERRRKTDANAKFYEEKMQAEATEKRADAEAHRISVLAKSERDRADALKYSMTSEADGIKSLTKVITPEYIKYVEAKSKMIASQNYKGDTPSTLTVLGDNGSVPFLNIK